MPLYINRQLQGSPEGSSMEKNPIVEKMKACKKCPNLGHVIREQKVKG